MKVLKTETDGDYIFECAGCGCSHLVTTKRKNDHGAQWQFNGNIDEPTFHPSIHIWILNSKQEKQTVCHCIINCGAIQYLSDCAHDLRGQIIEMSDIN